jgi:hypothetical protein
MLAVYFLFNLIDFLLQSIVFLKLSLQEAAGQRCLLNDACWGKQIGITKLVFVVAEVMNFDPAFINQGFEAIIQTAHAHAKSLSQLTLRDVGSVVQDTHHPEVGVFLLVGLAAGHGGLDAVGTLPQCLAVSAALKKLDFKLGRRVLFEVEQLYLGLRVQSLRNKRGA